MPGHTGLVETDESSLAIHRQADRWRKKPSPIGTAEHQVSRNDLSSRMGRTPFAWSPDPGDESPGYFQSPRWGALAEQDGESLRKPIQEDMDSRDRELLNVIQAAFPVEPHPYQVIGEKLGMDQNEVLARIANLKREGIIRRIGASINSRRIGFVSTLLAAKVPPEKFESFVQTVNLCPGVTHNYERKHAYNVWFTLIASSQAEKERIIRELTEKTGIEILELPATRIFKIRVDFRF